MPSAIIRTKLGRRVLDLGGTSANDRTGAFVEISDNEGLRATYGAFVAGITPAATPTDVFQIVGSATKLIRLKSIYLSGTATTASNIIVNLIQRTVANTGGTTSPVTGGQHDSTDDAITATLRTYTANAASLGTGTTVGGGRLNLAPAANGSIDRLAFDWSWRNEKAPVIQGVAQSFCVNLGGVAWPVGGALDIHINWTEEAIEAVL